MGLEERRFEWVVDEVPERHGGNRVEGLTLDEDHFTLSRGGSVRYDDVSDIEIRCIAGGDEGRSFVTRQLQFVVNTQETMVWTKGSLTSPTHTPDFVAGITVWLRTVERHRPDLLVSEIKSTRFLLAQCGWLVLSFAFLVLGIGVIVGVFSDSGTGAIAMGLWSLFGLVFIAFSLTLSPRLLRNLRRAPRQNVPLSQLAEAIELGDPAGTEALGDWFPLIVARKTD